jgi:DNA (cytosine-5)-methyltransferase 1
VIRREKPRLLDLFCGAGGAAMGYHRAGFEVVGVDIAPQPRYPFEFIQGDALEFLRALIDLRTYAAPKGDFYRLQDFDAIHASPPCQAYSITKHAHKRDHPDLVPQTLELLRNIGLPWVVENERAATPRPTTFSASSWASTG